MAQVISIYQWAKLSGMFTVAFEYIALLTEDIDRPNLDVIGRRPIVLLGIFGIGLATLFMGVSTTLSGVLFARSLGV